jgi:hypothetical protein
VSSDTKDIFVHVGLPKTGTTTLQAAFDHARAAMRDDGLLFPGERHLDQRRAVYDLLGRRIPGDDEQVAGAFAALVEQVHAFDGPRVLVSEELLGLARPRAVRRMARALQPHRLSVVIGVRDLGRTLPAAWQQEIVREGTIPWSDYVQAVRDPHSGARAGVAFWLRYDPVRVLDAWESVVPRDRVHVLTIPPAGAPPEELLERFGRVLSLPPGLFPRDVPVRNESLGATGVEVVRRLNLHLDGSLPRRQYTHVIERGVRHGLAEVPDRPLVLTEDELPWVRERATALIDELRRRNYPVEGNLDDLQPRGPGRPARRVDDVDESELLHATEQALTSAALAQGTLFRRYRRALGPRGGQQPGRRELLTSTARAVGFQTRVAALERADRSRVLTWAANRYLRRGSSRR